MPDASDPIAGKLNGGTLQCPCCDSRLALGEANSVARLVAEDAGPDKPALPVRS